MANAGDTEVKESEPGLVEPKAGRVLVVDDAPLTRTVLRKMLQELGYETVEAADGIEALEAIGPDIDLVLLDIIMPQMSGFEVATHIRLGGYCDDVPIIMVTSSSSMRDRLEAVEAGASDFICKPVEGTELRVRAASQVKIKRAQDSAKNYTKEIERVVEERTASLEQANAKLARLATTDALTGLYNHRCIASKLDEILSKTEESCALLFLDIDHFKALNDTFGHGTGDIVLRGFASLLEQTFAPGGICGRWGGEEFVIFLPGADAKMAAEEAERFRSAAAMQSFEGVELTVTCSIGVALYPLDGNTRSALAEAADRAMYVAKALGRNQVRLASEVNQVFEELQASTGSREETALEGLVNALTAMIAARDADTGRLTSEVERLANRMGMILDLPSEERQLLRLAARLHSIGKIAIPDSILLKQGPLTEADLNSAREYPVVGAEIVSHVPALRAIARSIRAHRERWDGQGFPDGLEGAAIPLSSRIVAVAEAYASLTCAKKALTSHAALHQMMTCENGRFDPSLVSTLRLSLRQDDAAA